METELATPYAIALGERLRRVRVQQDLSLHDVERLSSAEFKASVLGAYERGERAISVSRLRALAEFYRVPLHELVPANGPPAPVAPPARASLRIDLTRLSTTPLPESDTVGRFVANIQARRGDYNSRVITIRRDDLRALAAVLALSPSELRDRLALAGIVPAVDEPGEG